MCLYSRTVEGFLILPEYVRHCHLGGEGVAKGLANSDYAEAISSVITAIEKIERICEVYSGVVELNW